MFGVSRLSQCYNTTQNSKDTASNISNTKDLKNRRPCLVIFLNIKLWGGHWSNTVLSVLNYFPTQNYSKTKEKKQKWIAKIQRPSWVPWFKIEELMTSLKRNEYKYLRLCNLHLTHKTCLLHKVIYMSTGLVGILWLMYVHTNQDQWHKTKTKVITVANQKGHRKSINSIQKSKQIYVAIGVELHCTQ